VSLPKPAEAVVEAMISRGIAAGFPLSKYYPGMTQYMTVAVTEKRTRNDIERYAQQLKDVLGKI
jgi:glycine dehydrogenase subunit 1